eukprot:1879019-Amphidinium_carterae.1
MRGLQWSRLSRGILECCENARLVKDLVQNFDETVAAVARFLGWSFGAAEAARARDFHTLQREVLTVVNLVCVD